MMDLDADGQQPEPTCIARVKGAVMLRHRMACVVCHSMGGMLCRQSNAGRRGVRQRCSENPLKTQKQSRMHNMTTTADELEHRGHEEDLIDAALKLTRRRGA